MEIFGETMLPAGPPVRQLVLPGDVYVRSTRYLAPLVENMRVISTQYFDASIPITSHSLSAQVQLGGCCTSRAPFIRPLIIRVAAYRKSPILRLIFLYTYYTSPALHILALTQRQHASTIRRGASLDSVSRVNDSPQVAPRTARYLALAGR